MKKYYIKTGLVIIIILVSISALVAYLATKDNYKRVNNYDNLIPVEDYNTYFAITNNITNYLKATTDKETDQLYMLLDQKYIDRKRITKNNVHKKIPTYTEETIMEVESMKMATQDSGNVIYYATGKLIDNKYLEPKYINENYSIIVIVDYKSFTVSIYPVSDNPIDDINSILEKKELYQFRQGVYNYKAILVDHLGYAIYEAYLNKKLAVIKVPSIVTIEQEKTLTKLVSINDNDIESLLPIKNKVRIKK